MAFIKVNLAYSTSFEPGSSGVYSEEQGGCLWFRRAAAADRVNGLDAGCTGLVPSWFSLLSRRRGKGGGRCPLLSNEVEGIHKEVVNFINSKKNPIYSQHCNVK